MKLEQSPLLGILGGMGPLATVDFLGKLTRSLPAQCDQDHLPWITASQPGMPDRSRAIQNNDDGPVPYLVKGVAHLAAQGVKLIAVPCSTSHFWFLQMQAASSVPIMHIADAAVEELLRDRVHYANPVAILATRGTIKANIYRQRLVAADVDLCELNEDDQIEVDAMIADIKGGKLDVARQRMDALQASLSMRGAKTMILGCTELPLAYDDSAALLAAIDVSAALAKACLRRLGYLEA